jgi:geranylgeranyl pyrophosphate synthase
MNALQKSHLRDAFTGYMPLPLTLEPHLREALGRVLQNPGSMIRPEIVWEIALGYGLPEAPATDLAIALEYFHTASLLFDDLPAMDDALERRGTPCVHVEFGDAGAMLAALALVNRAYALTWRAAAAVPMHSQRRALDYVECHLGVDGLLNGQSMDLHYASLPHDQRTTERTAIGKTVSLIRLTLVLPAMLGGASDNELHLLERIALFWGLSYQIVDDLKDVLQNSTESGKTPSRDLALGRPNLALTLGIERAAERLQRLIALGDRTLDRLVAMRPSVSFLRKLRLQLGEEAAQLTQSVCAPAFGGGR